MYEQAPSRILSRTNEAILPQLDEESYCTIGCARLEPTPTGARVTLASGGHPLPLLLRSRGGKERTATVEVIGQSGMLVGLVPDLKVSDQVVELGPGDALLFYTDGVTEARTQDGFLGEERLAALFEWCADMDVHRMVAWIERAVFDLQTSDRRDDIAIVALRIPDQLPSALRDRLPEPEWMRGVRSFNAPPGLSSAPP
jgi:sigma-B regulation protein RsbU (phosphoserine phosphatase)